MSEILLNQEEIAYVTNKAIYSMLNNPGFLSMFTKSRLDILSISPNKKLIFIQGDRHTGFAHIQARHNFYTNAHSKSASGFIETSKFKSDSHPLPDYRAIAETLYDNAHLDDKNNKPEIFEVYRKKIGEQEYRLILYKGTKIVHTLFPIEKGKKTKKFERGDALTIRENDNTLKVLVPFRNLDGEIKYGIHITIHEMDKQEKWAFLIYDKAGNPLKFIRLPDQAYTCTFGIHIRIDQINNMNMDQVHELIQKCEKNN